jgi:hypothetical protein
VVDRATPTKGESNGKDRRERERHARRRTQDPAGDEGFRLGGWVGHIQDRPAVGKAALNEAL